MIRLLQDTDRNAEFVCARGDVQVNYLRTEAVPAHAGDLSRTYVMTGAEEGPSILGFYAICMGRISSSDLPENKGKKTPHASTPAALLAQLATDDRVERGEGKFLVRDALERIVAIADQIGCSGAFLHAQAETLVKYYTELGFRRVGRSDALQPTMWISMKDIRATIAAVAQETK